MSLLFFITWFLLLLVLGGETEYFVYFLVAALFFWLTEVRDKVDEWKPPKKNDPNGRTGCGYWGGWLLFLALSILFWVARYIWNS